MLNNNKKQETQFFGTKCGNANSIAAGYATETTNYGEIATGILNKSTKGDNPNSPEGVVGDPKATLFSVGCGTKEDRKNALEVKGDGSVIISGKDGSDVNIADLAEKADAASKVNVVLGDDNVLKVTDRTGTEKSLELVSQAAATEMVLADIEAYDKSSAVNGFMLNGQRVWLDKATRVGLMNSTSIAKAMGKTTTTLWFGRMKIEMNCDKAIGLLSALEMYALECFNVTAAHKKAVAELNTVEEVLEYDYTKDYPEQLRYDI